MTSFLKPVARGHHQWDIIGEFRDSGPNRSYVPRNREREIRKAEATGTLFLSVIGDANRAFTLESSTDLRTWVFMTTITTDGAGRGGVTDSLTERLKYYRTR